MPRKKKPEDKKAKKQENKKSDKPEVKKTVEDPERSRGEEKERVAGVEDISIVEEMETSYIDYAMSVIVARALPDVRDGLKPVHRRILYAMWSIGLKPGAKFRKSATVVGEVLGKYHPHGDQAVYDSMVRMAQDFNMRYMLVHGQGNFGSMDGDRAAAMRYTESKLRAISEDLLSDLDKDTVNFIPNYDGSQKEPQVLPAKLPHLLLNGGVGIAVGMATKIPPHNLTEICDTVSYLIDNPDCSTADLADQLPGPDFPTGGIIYDSSEIKRAYTTGKGKIVMRGKTEIVEEKSGSFRIIISEIPYQVNKASLLEKIAEFVKTKRLEGIRDVRDESNKDGVRVVIELKRDAYPKKVLNRLFKLTPLQTNFDVNMLALTGEYEPKVMTLKDILEYYLVHRQEVVRRRAEYELRKAEERAHILEGLKKAIDNIDAIIKLIKKSKDRDAAKKELIKQFKFSEVQAVAILEMRLQNLANLERLRIEAELKEKQKIIKELKGLLSSPAEILKVIKTEVTEIKEKYGDERKTKIIKSAVGEFSQEDLVPNDPTLIMVTRDGYIKRLPTDTFKTQKRGGKGVIGLNTKEEDVVDMLFTTMTHNDLLFFTSKGRVFKLKAYDVPVGSRISKGQALVNFLQLGPDEKVTAILPIKDKTDIKYLFMATENGVVKKTAIEDFINVRRSGLIAIKIKPGDSLRWVRPTTGKKELVMISARGQAIRFKEDDVRVMGRSASGVRGMRLKSEDKVVGVGLVEPADIKDLQVLCISENGFGKRSELAHYKVQNRGGGGIRTLKVSSKTGKVVKGIVANKQKSADDDILVISNKGQVIRMPFKGISTLGRDTQGVRLMRFKATGDAVAAFSPIITDAKERE
ncbi:DNA gyrase subunit A [Candidatus Kuenenbacteria bacterium]|nr:DNA gyrase subunit A [Candidatus Kuenenbacteria bacterium]